jgi:hypothetical protein
MRSSAPRPLHLVPLRTSPWAIASLLCAIGIACPLLALLAPILGIKAVAHIRNTPGIGGVRVAVAGIVIGTIGILLWSAVAYVWHAEVRTPILHGPETELREGLAGDVAAFMQGFTKDGALAPRDEAAAFLREVGGRYGLLLSVQQDTFRADPEPGRMSSVIPYVLRFESGLVQAEAKLRLFADGISPRWEYIVILDDEVGDLSFPQGFDRLPPHMESSDENPETQ